VVLLVEAVVLRPVVASVSVPTVIDVVDAGDEVDALWGGLVVVTLAEVVEVGGTAVVVDAVVVVGDGAVVVAGASTSNPAWADPESRPFASTVCAPVDVPLGTVPRYVKVPAASTCVVPPRLEPSHSTRTRSPGTKPLPDTTKEVPGSPDPGLSEITADATTCRSTAATVARRRSISFYRRNGWQTRRGSSCKHDYV
jgi:hypothetical protein